LDGSEKIHRSNVVAAILASGAHWIAETLFSIWPDEVFAGIAEGWINFSREQQDRWIPVLQRDANVVLQAVFAGIVIPDQIMTRLVERVDSRDLRLTRLPPQYWVDLICSSPEKENVDIAAFTLALSLQVEHYDTVLKCAFSMVHSGLERGALTWGWSKLERVLPDLGGLNWDRCERLRRALAVVCEARGWNIEELQSVAGSERAFERVIAYFGETPSGRRYLRRSMQQGLVRSPPSILDWIVRLLR